MGSAVCVSANQIGVRMSTKIEIAPVFVQNRRLRKCYLIDNDMSGSEARNVINDAIEYATDLLDDKIPFLVYENEVVKSGKRWLAVNAE
jgi:hypothetical protein